jgi:hypothetical protein
MKPSKLFAAAVLLWLLFLLLHAAGLRESVPALSLTHPAGKSFERAVVEMALYLLAYFGATLAAPILALTAGLQLGWQRLSRPRPLTSSAAPESRTRPAAGP